MSLAVGPLERVIDDSTFQLCHNVLKPDLIQICAFARRRSAHMIDQPGAFFGRHYIEELCPFILQKFDLVAGKHSVKSGKWIVPLIGHFSGPVMKVCTR